TACRTGQWFRQDTQLVPERTAAQSPAIYSFLRASDGPMWLRFLMTGLAGKASIPRTRCPYPRRLIELQKFDGSWARLVVCNDGIRGGGRGRRPRARNP